MSFLLFDYDRSIATLGGSEGVKNLLGVPPIQMQGGVKTFKDLLDKVVQPEEREIEHPVLGATGETEIRIVPNEKGQQIGLQGIVIDTVSRLARYEKEAQMRRMNAERKDKGKSVLKRLDQQAWGEYGDMLRRMFRMLTKLDMTVVVTCHESSSRDENGFRYFGPNIQGSASDSFPEYFDIVMYTRVEGDGSGARRFWQTKDNDVRPQAKDRKNCLPDEVNFAADGEVKIQKGLSSVVRAYRQNGVQHPKIAIIGRSGSGKTLSIGTLQGLV